MNDTISKDMILGKVIAKFPQAAEIMLEYGLHCIGCHVAAEETIEQGAKAHGLTDEQVEEMVSKMNTSIEKKE